MKNEKRLAVMGKAIRQARGHARHTRFKELAVKNVILEKLSEIDALLLREVRLSDERG